MSGSNSYLKRRVERAVVEPDPRLLRWNAVSWKNAGHRTRYWRLSRVEEIRDLQLEVGPGKCPYCERPLKRPVVGATRVVCFRWDCYCEYQQAYSRLPDRRAYGRARDRARRDANRALGLRGDGTPRTPRAPQGSKYG